MRVLTLVCLDAMLITGGAFDASAIGNCSAPIAVSARAPNGLNFDPPQHYDTEKLARRRAIDAWRRQVAKSCPGYSTLWWRAGNKKVACEGYAGGIECSLSAEPAGKL